MDPFTSLAIILAILILLAFCLLPDPGNRLPPGSFGWPIIGETIPFKAAAKRGQLHQFIKNKTEKYRTQIIKTSMFGEICVVPTGSDAIKFLFTNEKKFLTGWRPRSIQKLFPSTASSMSIEDDPKRQRGFLGTLFKTDTLGKLVNSIESVTKTHLKTHWKDGHEVRVYDLVKLFAFTVACKMFLGIEETDQTTKLLKPFMDLTQGAVSLDIYFPGTIYYRAKNASKVLHKEIRLIITKRRKDIAKNDVVEGAGDLLTQMLIRPCFDGSFLNEMQIVDMILGFLIGGHETTAANITLAMKNIVMCPQHAIEVLKEQEEIVEVIEPRGEMIWEDLQKMKKTWNFVSEVMRMFPPIQAASREAKINFSFDGFFVPKGWKILNFMECTQMDPNYFPEPKKFDPSRFAETGPKSYTFFPFGGGSRMCPGNDFARTTILIFMHHILKNFKWQPLAPEEGITYKFVPVPDRGFPVHLFAR